MELTKQVCSLDLAKRLKELGVKQQSLFRWHPKSIASTYVDPEYVVSDGGFGDNSLHGNLDISAFTVAELGEMLPAEFPGDSDSDLVTFKGEANDFVKWFVRYENDAQKIVSHGEVSETEADARAKMLIYLIENNLLTV